MFSEIQTTRLRLLKPQLIWSSDNTSLHGLCIICFIIRGIRGTCDILGVFCSVINVPNCFMAVDAKLWRYVSAGTEKKTPQSDGEGADLETGQTVAFTASA